MANRTYGYDDIVAVAEGIGDGYSWDDARVDR